VSVEKVVPAQARLTCSGLHTAGAGGGGGLGEAGGGLGGAGGDGLKRSLAVSNSSGAKLPRLGRTSSSALSGTPNHCATPCHTLSDREVGISRPRPRLSGHPLSHSANRVGYLPWIWAPRTALPARNVFPAQPWWVPRPL
jgi:hypothetical protein